MILYKKVKTISLNISIKIEIIIYLIIYYSVVD